MNFIEGFTYPFKSWAKLLTLVLFFSILIVGLAALSMESLSQDGTSALTYWITTAQTLFLSGYGIRTVRSLMDGQEKLPSIEILKDIGRGLVVLVATILYMIPVIVILGCGMSAGLSLDFIISSDSNDLGPFLLSMAIMIPLLIYFNWGITVGMLRYAAEERRKALFEFRTNFGYVHANIGATLHLTAFNIVMFIIYNIAIRFVSGAYNDFVGGTFDYSGEPNAILIVVSISSILTLVLSLLQQFGNLHFSYQYAHKLDIRRGHYKSKSGAFSQ